MIESWFHNSQDGLRERMGRRFMATWRTNQQDAAGLRQKREARGALRQYCTGGQGLQCATSLVDDPEELRAGTRRQ